MQTKILTGAALAGAFALGAIVVAYSSAQQSTSSTQPVSAALETSFSNTQEDDIRNIVRDYLLANPEVIIEAVNEYSARQQAQEATRQVDAAKGNLAKLLDPSGGFVTGKDPKNAKVAVIELYDYHCGFCKRALPLVNEITSSDEDVMMVFRELPILREESDIAAEYSLAAREQGKFMAFHNAMMEASGTLDETRIHSIAKTAGLDVDKLKNDRGDAGIPAAITTTHEIAQSIGVTGTPTFIVATTDGAFVEVIQGFRADDLVAKIEEAKEVAG